MTSEFFAWSAIALMAVVTLVTRLIGPEIVLHVKVAPWTRRFLDALSSSVIAAIVASFLARSTLREAAALAMGACVMWLTGHAMLAMIAGVLTAAMWSVLAAAPRFQLG